MTAQQLTSPHKDVNFYFDEEIISQDKNTLNDFYCKVLEFRRILRKASNFLLYYIFILLL